MFNKMITLRNSSVTLLFTSIVKITSFFKVSFILGSAMAFFSLTPMVQPLIGVWGGLFGSTGFFALGIVLRLIMTGSLSFILLAYHIPGLFASYALASRHWVLHVALPLVCIALFIAHPVGLNAFPYTFYWFIPVALYFANKELFFFRALSSTFIAHAVGSVIWLWAQPMTPLSWLALIPVAFVERIVFALGMTMIYHAVCGVQKLFKTKKQAVATLVVE